MFVLSAALAAAATPDALATYQACIRQAAVKVGARESITVAQANEIVAKCKAQLGHAAVQIVDRGYRINAPAHMQTRAILVKAAAFDIEHQARMSVSARVLPLPVR